jgi:isoaspartyl peptidase/L-asparaginase-like protein (Ntn-hydrolase superfamily)
VVVQLDQTNQRQEKMMASEKIKTNSAPENEAPPKKKSTSGAEASKADGRESAAASPPGYSRGEGQKPVSKAYRDNWNVIFAKKKKR